MIERKLKPCAYCGKDRRIKGHGLCNNCYNLAQWQYHDSSIKPDCKFPEFAHMSKDERRVVLKEARDQKRNSYSKYPVKTKNRNRKSVLIERVDKYFSQLIRLTDAVKGSDGKMYNRCFTCDALRPVSKKKGGLHCGHFHSRRHMGTRWHPDNCRPQCYQCNCNEEGVKPLFRLYLSNELLDRGVRELDLLAYSNSHVPNELELEAMAKEFRQQVKELQIKQGVKTFK